LLKKERKKGRFSEKKPYWCGDIAIRLGVRIPPPAPLYGEYRLTGKYAEVSLNQKVFLPEAATHKS